MSCTHLQRCSFHRTIFWVSTNTCIPALSHVCHLPALDIETKTTRQQCPSELLTRKIGKHSEIAIGVTYFSWFYLLFPAIKSGNGKSSMNGRNVEKIIYQWWSSIAIFDFLSGSQFTRTNFWSQSLISFHIFHLF